MEDHAIQSCCQLISLREFFEVHRKRKAPVSRGLSRAVLTAYSTVMFTACEGIPFATTTIELAPASIPLGTSKFVKTTFVPVATAMVLWSCVLA